MKKIIIFLYLACYTLTMSIVFGQELSKEEENAVLNFIDCVKNKQKEKLAAHIAFPLKREYPIADIKNKKEFLMRYDEVFDAELSQKIANSTLDKDWAKVGWRGIMLSNGLLWLDIDGRLLSVNYQSKAEAEKREQIINADRKKLHESLQEFQHPVHVLVTPTYRIRIDDTGKGRYRYAAWKLKNKMKTKPDLVIENGEHELDGNGGNYILVFKNGEYRYDCAINLLAAEDTPSATLTIYKNEKKMLFENAKMIR
jgi:hypothetical protein